MGRSRAILFRLIPIFLCLIALVRGEAAPEITIAPVPAWVKVIDSDSVSIPKTTPVENGVDYVLVDCQTLMDPEAQFDHYSLRVINDHGLADAGEIKGTFDPSYQKFTLHWLRVKRDGVWQDRIVTDKFQLLQREEGLDSQMLDGRYSAECHLQDIRVGDVIDYAYTVTGANPVFKGKYADTFSTTWGSPVHLFSQRLITASNRHVSYKSYVNSLTPTVTTNADQTQLLEWTKSEVPASFEDGGTPNWYDTFGWVQLSEYSSWKDVVDWGLGNYQFDAPLSPQLQEKIDEISKKSAVPEERALRAIRFVQDDIRYLGIEMGASSYKPTPASLACEHRFGDCKDKAFLCVVMLRALGIEAYPALVNTYYRQETDKLLPSALDFNHAIVQLVVDGRTYWVDVTRDAQRGRLRALFIRDYKRALVLKPGTDSLSSLVVSPESMPDESVFDTYEVKSVTDPVKFKVHTVYKGLSAENTRSDFAEASLEKTQKSYLTYYAGHFPKIKVSKPLHFQDFPEDNRFEVWEEYDLPDFWSRKTQDVPWKAEFEPFIISDTIGDPPSAQRTSPYHQNFPSDVSEDIEVRLFEDWNVEPKPNDLTTPYFLYTEHPSSDKNIVHFRYRYKPLIPDIFPENIAEFHDEIKKLQANLDYNLTYQPKVTVAPAKPDPFRPNWLVYFMVALILSAVGYLAFRIYEARLPYPPPPPTTGELEGYDGVLGWLILFAIGLVVRIGIYVKSILTDYVVVWDANKWNGLTIPGAASYDPMWAPALLFEMAFTLVFPVLSALALVLMFQKRAVLPRLAITILLLTLVAKVIDVAMVGQIAYMSKQHQDDASGLSVLVFYTIIWVLYFLFSKRVKATFRC